MKISNILLSTMISASLLICIESNSQTSNKQLSRIEKIKKEKARKVIAENKKRIAKLKQDSIKKLNEVVIRNIDKYCPGCGKG